MRARLLPLLTALALTGLARAEEAAPLPVPEPPVLTLAVPGDAPVEVVPGPADSPRVAMYLHGVCGDPLAFRAWRRAIAQHATLISLRGDLRCEDKPGRTKWSYDFAAMNTRVERAIAAVSATRPVPLDPSEVVLIGYSQGARRAESLAARFPDRYKRVALIAIASEPSLDKLRHQQAILLMAGELDRRDHIQHGADTLARAGKHVHLSLLPKAKHGEYGPEAERVMSEGLTWLFGATGLAKDLP